MNNVNLIGRLTSDIELKQTNSGKAVCSFCIAIDAGQDKTNFIDCVAWEGRAENIAKNFKKGSKIGIAGMLTTRTYEDEGKKRKVTEVLVISFDFCTEKPKENAEPQEEPAAPKMTAAERAASVGVEPATHSELPFEI